MSFSFTKNAPTKQALQEAVRQALDEVCAVQPSHHVDKHHVEQAVAQKLDLLGEAREGEHYYAHASGSITARGGSHQPTEFSNISLNCSVYIYMAPAANAQQA